MWRWMGHKTLTPGCSKSFIMDCHTGAVCGLQAKKAKPQREHDSVYRLTLMGFIKINSAAIRLISADYQW